MTLTDAAIAMLLAAHLHGTEEAVRKTATRCLRQLSSDAREERNQLVRVVIAESPYEAALCLAQEVEGTSANNPAWQGRRNE